jgi:hypothetical protein
MNRRKKSGKMRAWFMVSHKTGRGTAKSGRFSFGIDYHFRSEEL